MTASKHRYFKAEWNGEVRELPGPHWKHPISADLRFSLAVLAEAENTIQHARLNFYITKNPYTLPEYGPNVVAVLTGDERCKMPAYARHVLAVIRNGNLIPFLGFRPHVVINRADLSLALEYARDWALHWRSLRALSASRPSWPPLVNPMPRILTIPFGYHSQEELPQIPMRDRTLDAFFAGGVATVVSRTNYRYWVSSKIEARKQLWRVLNQLKRNPEWNIDLSDIDVGLNPGSSEYSHSYSVRMANSRVCLAPRGTRAETYRLYEGLRAGCLVITNRLPDVSFLQGAPIIQVDHWKELPQLLEHYARDVDALDQIHEASLNWWNSKCSETAIGRQVAQFLNNQNQ